MSYHSDTNQVTQEKLLKLVCERTGETIKKLHARASKESDRILRIPIVGDPIRVEYVKTDYDTEGSRDPREGTIADIVELVVYARENEFSETLKKAPTKLGLLKMKLSADGAKNWWLIPGEVYSSGRWGGFYLKQNLLFTDAESTKSKVFKKVKIEERNDMIGQPLNVGHIVQVMATHSIRGGSIMFPAIGEVTKFTNSFVFFKFIWVPDDWSTQYKVGDEKRVAPNRVIRLHNQIEEALLQYKLML